MNWPSFWKSHDWQLDGADREDGEEKTGQGQQVETQRSQQHGQDGGVAVVARDRRDKAVIEPRDQKTAGQTGQGEK